MSLLEPRATVKSRPRWRDLREWIEAVERTGELKVVRGASAEADIGAITEMLEHSEGSPSVLFDEIPRYEAGYRVMVNGMGTVLRQGITLGMDPADATHEKLLGFWREMLRGWSPIPPTVVDRGPIQENIVRDEEVDLSRFPAPIWHPLDGGPYIGTASVNIMRDPETGGINAGTYRNEVFGKNTIGIRAAPPHHGGVIRQKYDRMGEPCPIVVVVGGDPLLFLASCIDGIPYGQSELDWAGGVRGEPVEVIEGELTGLPIPAHAEIALEGYISTEDQDVREGPYGEWMGYYEDGYPRNRVITIRRVYHRNNPIILGCPQGKPPHEDSQFLAYQRSAMIWDQLEKAGVPEVQAVWSPPVGGGRLLTVVSIKQRYPGHSTQAGLVASQCGAGINNCRMTVVVDEYVDVVNLQDVMWAILTRCEPARDIQVLTRTQGSRIDMAINPTERHVGFASRIVIDATTPYEWKDDPRAGAPITTRERAQAIRDQWGWILQ